MLPSGSGQANRTALCSWAGTHRRDGRLCPGHDAAARAASQGAARKSPARKACADGRVRRDVQRQVLCVCR